MNIYLSVNESHLKMLMRWMKNEARKNESVGKTLKWLRKLICEHIIPNKYRFAHFYKTVTS